MSLKGSCLLLIFLIPFTIANIRASSKLNNGFGDKEVGLTKRYKPDFDDLNSRPLPRWYDSAKIGIMLHWGVYAVPAYGPDAEFFWLRLSSKEWREYMDTKFPGLTYQDFAPMFTAELFDPDEWASLFAKAGAKYVVLTTKHHEGYYLFPSAQNKWNSVEVGPRRDIVSDLSSSVTKKGLKFGVYYSLYQWYNSTYSNDSLNNYTTRIYPETIARPDIKQLMNDYKPSLLWLDGDFFECYTYWNALESLAWLYNDSPVKDEIVTNERWGKMIAKYCGSNAVDKKLGDFYNYKDDYEPDVLQDHKFESATRMDKRSWGYRSNYNASDIWKYSDLLIHVVKTVSFGGNALINLGPTKAGTIDQVFKDLLLTLGKWLKINGDAIYSSSPWFYQKDSGNSDVWYTCTKAEYNGAHPTRVPSKNDTVTAIYAITLKWPPNRELKIKDIASTLQSGKYDVHLLGNEDTILYKVTKGEAVFKLPGRDMVKSRDAWTLKFTEHK